MFKFKLLPLVIILLLASCQEKMIFRLSDDSGYAENPILSVRALDGDRWIEGTLDEEAKTIGFSFRVLEDLSKVPMRVQLNGKWPSMVTPEEPIFEANLQNLFKISVNDGVDVVNYEVVGERYGFVKSVTLVKGEETIECNLDYLAAKGKFNEMYLYSDLSDVKVQVELGENVALVNDPQELYAVDFTQAGRSLELKVKDEQTGHTKILKIDAVPADVVSLDESWEDVTVPYKEEHGLSTLSPSGLITLGSNA